MALLIQFGLVLPHIGFGLLDIPRVRINLTLHRFLLTQLLPDLPFPLRHLLIKLGLLLGQFLLLVPDVGEIVLDISKIVLGNYFLVLKFSDFLFALLDRVAMFLDPPFSRLDFLLFIL